MQTFLLDTGIVLGYARGERYAEYVDREFAVFNHVNTALISVVSKGELYSLSIQFSWGPNKQKLLNELLRKLPTVDINDEQIIQRYADIDAYGLNKDRSKPLPKGQTARQMGKNDLWIAATASVLRATLLTTDSGFNHLDKVFLDVVYVDPKLTVGDI